jgi:hypothetical protein
MPDFEQGGADVEGLNALGSGVLLILNFRFASIEASSAFKYPDLIGDEHVMLETDYPHPGQFPAQVMAFCDAVFRL